MKSKDLHRFIFTLGILAGFIFWSPVAMAGDLVREFSLKHPKILKFQLSYVLNGRCKYYSGAHQEQCSSAIRSMINLLEISGITLTDPTGHRADYIVTLSKSTLAITGRPEARAFLVELLRQVDGLLEDIEMNQFIYPDNIQSIDLGTLGSRYFGNREETISVLAALFQDLPRSQVQVALLRKSGANQEFADLLEKVIAKISTVNVRKGLKYPISIFGQSLYNSKIYHALIPAYLSMKLQRIGYSERISILIPFLFNYIYEASQLEGSIQALLGEPKAIFLRESQDDILAGSLGAAIGIRQEHRLPTKTEARQSLQEYPAGYIRDLTSRFN